MSEAFDLAVDADGVGVVTFDLPDRSVNLFQRQVLAELESLLDELGGRDDIRVLVLRSGKPRVFIAGADVDLIADVTDPTEAEAGARLGQRLFRAWSQLPFPTVAAIRGTCVGGGTELALASDLILISDRDDIRIGLPEIRLGILPGWGGCTRLPQRIGIQDAMGIILPGRTVDARKAYRIGLADALLPDALFEEHVRRLALAHLERSQRRQVDGGVRDFLLERNPLGRRLLFEQARKRTLAKTDGHYPAPLRAIEVIRTGVEEGPEAGFDAEARAVAELAVSRPAKNLIHVFRLMESAKHTGEPEPEDPDFEVGQVGVLGAGLMGGGIAQLVAVEAGVPVRLKDIAAEPLASGVAHAARLFAKLVERRRMTAPEAERRLQLLRAGLTYDGLGRADLVIEAVVERLAVKQQVFGEVAAVAREDAILASNTSSISIDEIAGDTAHPERIVGMHFFNPVHRMPLVEIVSGRRTAPAVARSAARFARRLGKTPVLVADSPGFLVNRLLMFYALEALWLLEEGVPIETIDRAMTAWGMPMGPLTLTDEVGWDVATEVARILHDAFGDRLPLPEWIGRGVEEGRLGRKNGRGYYRYQNGERGDPDPTVYELVGSPPTRHEVDPSALTERMVLRMVDEAARCLDEGVVATPGELDLALIMGTGFPPFRGGLCRWADAEGLPEIVRRLEEMAETIEPRFHPGTALTSAAEAGGFYG